MDSLFQVWRKVRGRRLQQVYLVVSVLRLGQELPGPRRVVPFSKFSGRRKQSRGRFQAVEFRAGFLGVGSGLRSSHVRLTCG